MKTKATPDFSHRVKTTSNKLDTKKNQSQIENESIFSRILLSVLPRELIVTIAHNLQELGY